MNAFYEFFYNQFAGKTIVDQMKTLIFWGFVIFLLELVLTKLVKWIKRKLK